jgi:predicted phage-related endonuclease
MSRNELHSIIKELKEYKNLKEEAEARISELEATIKAHMTEQDTDTLIIDEFKCKLTIVSTNRLDNKALQSECPDIYSRFVKASSYQRFTVA